MTTKARVEVERIEKAKRDKIFTATKTEQANLDEGPSGPPDQPENTEDQFVPTLPLSNTETAIGGSGTPALKNQSTHSELGNSYEETGNYAAAIKSYQSMLAASPSDDDSVWLRCLIGCCYRLQGKYPKPSHV